MSTLPDGRIYLKRYCAGGCGKVVKSVSYTSAEDRKPMCMECRRSDLDRECAYCSKPFRLKWATQKKRYCDVRCAMGARTLPEKPCEGCGELFRPDRHTRRFCSIRCRNLNNQPKPEVGTWEHELEELTRDTPVKAPGGELGDLEDQGRAVTPEQWRVLLWLADGDAMKAAKLRNGLGARGATVGELLAG